MARSTYYFEINKIDPVAIRNEELLLVIKKIFVENKGRYGVRRVYMELKNRGYNVNHKRVQRLMHDAGLFGKRPKEKYELVAQVIAGVTISSVAYDVGINTGLLAQWIRKYKIWGYNGLVGRRKGRKPKESAMKKMNINNPRKLNESEYEELIRLRAEITYIKAENEAIKKEIALREEREAALLKAKKQQSSKNSKKKDIC